MENKHTHKKEKNCPLRKQKLKLKFTVESGKKILYFKSVVTVIIKIIMLITYQSLETDFRCFIILCMT